jgi:SnoaL-like domain
LEGFVTHSIRFAGLVFVGLAAAMSAVTAAAGASSERALEARIDRLERRLQGLEDVDAINKLTRAYGYYVDKQLWDQVAVLFSNDCIIEIAGRGVYRGRKGADDLFRGSMGQGELGLKPGTLFNHMILQGIVDVDANGITAKARWRAFVQIAQYQKFALWSEGTYENTYVKEGGKWKFSGMHFYSTYYTPFDQGWAKSNLPNNGPSETYPPDAPPSLKYDVFPGHYVPPFHYANPVTGVPWTLEDTSKYSTSGMSPVRPPVPGQPPEPVPAAPSGH